MEFIVNRLIFLVGTEKFTETKCSISFFTIQAAGTFLLIFGIIALIESGGLPAHTSFSPIQWMFNLTVLCVVVGVTTVFISLAGFIGSLREIRVLLKCVSLFVR